MVFTVGPQKKYIFFKWMKTLYLRIAALQITMEREKKWLTESPFWFPVSWNLTIIQQGLIFFFKRVGIAFE